ncbi:Hypothetical predicted protein [Olea europaea subsp. europaea]|uniref:Uncharacterized protein n=1 Tax=Olea europaea subsp. europaea TaxID=158383 RepID=A0A8S0T858_OLEEU|nr:Hypothetical predicted protein [Olea europaea subsp. europaea]
MRAIRLDEWPFSALTQKGEPQKQVTLTSRHMVKSTGQGHTQEGRNERPPDKGINTRRRRKEVKQSRQDGVNQSQSTGLTTIQ